MSPCLSFQLKNGFHTKVDNKPQPIIKLFFKQAQGLVKILCCLCEGCSRQVQPEGNLCIYLPVYNNECFGSLPKQNCYSSYKKEDTFKEKYYE